MDKHATIALMVWWNTEVGAVRHAAELALGRIDVNWACSEMAQRAMPQFEALYACED